MFLCMCVLACDEYIVTSHITGIWLVVLFTTHTHEQGVYNMYIENSKLRLLEDCFELSLRKMFS